MTTPPTVVTVLRSGGEFTPEHARALHDAIWQHWPEDQPLRQVCLTNVAIGLPSIEEIPLHHLYPGWWSKMELFRPANEALGDILYFDLDTIVVGDLTDIAATRVLTLLADFYHEGKLGSGLMYLPLDDRPAVWKRWEEAPTAWMRQCRGDQEFLGPPWLARAETWQTFLPDQVVSYKVHVKPAGRVPEGARVVCFHGRPRPWSLRGGLPHG